tara:strand:+ start:702 stop:965 length:264 start_codon:yes stop_codon:yes gene_type:complete
MAGKSINIEVRVGRGESVQRATKRFNKKVKNSGILDEYIKRKQYEKPSSIRNRRNRLRKRIIEQQNEAIKQEERDMYKTKPRKKRRR